jgi:outer membrane receptor protein involved in Fe transport
MMALMVGASAWSLAAGANAQDAQAAAPKSVEEVVVTGSRTIANGNNSPSPVTVVQLEQIQATTPSNVPDALGKLPSFIGSRSNTSLNNASSNNTGAFLNLRGFGIIRTLILEDGRRVPSSAQDGTVDTNTLPQMLIQRVDVVTGGASAVYGSDAVTGVVNFVLDHNYNGVKLQAQGGVSSRRDDGSWRFGIAGGRSLFDGRLHVEGSYEHYSSDGVDLKLKRPGGALVPCLAGAGTVANPYRYTINCRNNTSSFGGLITSGPLKGMDFAANGQLSPFVHGTPTGATNVESGGNGSYSAGSSMAAFLRSDQFFGRVDYDVGGGIKAFAQAAVTNAYNGNHFTYFGQATAITLSANNAFLTPAQQAAASAGGATSFTMGKVYSDNAPIGPHGDTSTIDVTGGLSGRFADKYDWSLYYTHGQTRLHEINNNNINLGKMSASLDAVIDPKTGNIVCNVTLTNPGLYPGCVPTNPFGPTSTQPTGTSYWRNDTSFTLNNYMDDVGASLTGDVFQLPAGPIRAAASFEYRKLRLTNASDFLPTDRVNCTGLRFNCAPQTATATGTFVWQNNVTAPMSASEGITEGALEATVPVLKDLPFVQSFDINGAVRYAQYSISGNATTWKIGGDWHANDELNFRGTRSQDIRAPTLNDLFSPITTSSTGFTDSHTNTPGFPTLQTQGNRALVPEVSQTWTVGFVYRPKWIPRLSLAIDYFNMEIGNAITQVGGNNATFDQLCDASGGSSPFCALYLRPLPFSNTSPANFPSILLSQPLNVAQTRTNGLDTELNYNFRLEDIAKPLAGRVDLRLLGTYQPTLAQTPFVGGVSLNSAGAAAGTLTGTPTVRLTFIGSYKAGPWTINAQTRWRNALKQNANPALIIALGNVPAVSFTDLTVNYDLQVNGYSLTTFVSVQNVFDQMAPIFVGTGSGGVPGFGNVNAAGDDLIGRYMTAGIRMRF